MQFALNNHKSFQSLVSAIDKKCKTSCVLAINDNLNSDNAARQKHIELSMPLSILVTLIDHIAFTEL